MGASSSSSTDEAKHFDALLARTPSQHGKTHAVTGTTSGTGFILATALAHKGARVLCLNRPSERASKALEQLAEAAPDAEILQVDCDLKSFESVRAAAEEVTRLCPEGLDVLVANAGITDMPDERTADGYDVQMQVNALSHVLLTKELWPLLERAAERTGEARVVSHSSALRVFLNKPLASEYLERNGGNLGGDGNIARTRRYQQSKLANAVFTYALADRLAASGSKVKSVCAHPGLARTNLQSGFVSRGNALQNASARLFMAFAQSVRDGAQGVLLCAAGTSDEVSNGSFFGPGSGLLAAKGRAVALDRAKETLADAQEAKDLLWARCEAVFGKFDF